MSDMGWSRYIAAQEDAEWGPCFEAATKHGLSLADAEDCDNGNHACPTCPHRDLFEPGGALLQHTPALQVKVVPVRPERTMEQFSRGLEVVRSIRAMWDGHSRLPAGSNEIIERNIRALMAEFDLTLTEWYYWSRKATAK